MNTGAVVAIIIILILLTVVIVLSVLFSKERKKKDCDSDSDASSAVDYAENDDDKKDKSDDDKKESFSNYNPMSVNEVYNSGGAAGDYTGMAWGQYIANQSLDPSVFSSHQDYARDSLNIATGPSTYSIKERELGPVPYVGLRRIDGRVSVGKCARQVPSVPKEDVYYTDTGRLNF